MAADLMPFSSYKMVIVDFSKINMKKKGRYLVRQKMKKDAEGKIEQPYNPSIREWECLETTLDYFKIQDLVDVKDIVYTMFRTPAVEVITKAYKPFWLSVLDLVNEYEILEELE